MPRDHLTPPGRELASTAPAPPGGRAAAGLQERALLVTLVHLIQHSQPGAEEDAESWIARTEILGAAGSLGYSEVTVGGAVSELVRLKLLEARPTQGTDGAPPDTSHRRQDVRVTRSGAALVKAASDAAASCLEVAEEDRRRGAQAAAASALSHLKRITFLWALSKSGTVGLRRHAAALEVYSSDEREALGLDGAGLAELISIKHVPPLEHAGLLRAYRQGDNSFIDRVEPAVLDALSAATAGGVVDPPIIREVASRFSYPHRLQLFHWFTGQQVEGETEGVPAIHLEYAFADWARRTAASMVDDGVLRDEFELRNGTVVRRQVVDGVLGEKVVMGPSTTKTPVRGSSTSGGHGRPDSATRVVRRVYWLHPDYSAGGRCRPVIDALAGVLRAAADVVEARTTDPHPVLEVLAKPNFLRLGWSMVDAHRRGLWPDRQTLATQHGLDPSTLTRLFAAGVRTGLFVRTRSGGRRGHLGASIHLARYLALATQAELGLAVGLQPEQDPFEVALEVRSVFLERIPSAQTTHTGPRSPGSPAHRGPRLSAGTPTASLG